MSDHYEEILLRVGGMHCGSCARRVTAALRTLEGVRDVEVRVEEGRVRIARDPARTSVDDAIQAVRDAGYEAAVA